jgi:Rrf2 family protein
VRLAARVDYCVRAALELAAADPEAVKADQISTAQRIPPRFLANIMSDLVRAGVARSQRGAEGGYRLARAADEISIADVIRVEEGFLIDIHGERPEELEYTGAAEHLREVWVAARAAYRAVLEQVTLQDVVEDSLPAEVQELVDQADAWRSGPRPSA